MPLEGVDLVKREVALAKRFPHFMTSSSQPRVSGNSTPEEKCLLPFGKDEFLARMMPLCTI